MVVVKPTGCTCSTQGAFLLLLFLRQTLSESVNNKERVRLWHTRLGHASLKCQQFGFPKKCFFSSDLDFQCETCCQFSKHCRTTFPLNNNRSSSPFSLIHSSVWGPAQVVSIFGFRYSISFLFIDDCTRYTWIYLLKSRDLVPSIVKIFLKMVLTQYDTQVKTFRSDNAREYLHHALKKCFLFHGIDFQTG